MSQQLRLHSQPLRYEDYAAIENDGRRWELIDGELEVNPAPSSRHQTVSRRLQHELMLALEDTGLAEVFNAPVDVLLGEHDVLQPDLVIVPREKRDIIVPRGIEGVPQVVVEILSPGTAVLDRRVKRATYEKYGIPEYWLVDPHECWIDQLHLDGNSYRIKARFENTGNLTTPSFPEVKIDLARVFRE